MSPEQVKIIKKTWKTVSSMDAAIVGDVFYSKLFTTYPFVRKMFPDDMNLQNIKLVQMLTSIVTSIDLSTELDEELIAMAKRHTAYGVKPAHYHLIGETLIWTLKTALNEEWNAETEEAWLSYYNHLSQIMITNA